MTVSPYDFEYPLGVLSSDRSKIGIDRFISNIEKERMRVDPDIYKKIIVGNLHAGLMVSIATVLLVVIFIYGLAYKDNADPNVMVYSTILSIGLLVASGVVI